MERLILDTGVLVEAARGRLALDEISDESDPAVPAIVVTEYLVGVQLDKDPGRCAAKRDFLTKVLNTIPVEDYTVGVAESHAELIANTRAGGKPHGPHDLIVAATAHATDRTILTTDGRARFDALPGVTARVVTSSRS
ncbi:PIN domain-containing protein [Haloechinothrix salitolerans]|uniref:Ribonuclease VapC n=1 Tax=Haloechinothrix salitolerans TaxID=926830 RepID=A0ABW2C5G8_9PSEU